MTGSPRASIHRRFERRAAPLADCRGAVFARELPAGFSRRKMDCQHFAIHFVAGPSRIEPKDVDLFAERGHRVIQVEAERTLAGDLHRRLGCAASGPGGPAGLPADPAAATVGLSSDSRRSCARYLAAERERFDAVDRRRFALLARRIFTLQQDCHIAAAAVAAAETKIDDFRRHDAVFDQLDVAGDDHSDGLGHPAATAGG